MKSDLKVQIQKVNSRANQQSEKWWGIIGDDDSFEPYTDEDQSEVDTIVSQYRHIINQLLQNNSK